MKESESEVTQSCPILRDPMDFSPPGSSVHGIFQARVLEWGAIAFSESKRVKYVNFRQWRLQNKENYLRSRGAMHIIEK